MALDSASLTDSDLRLVNGQAVFIISVWDEAIIRVRYLPDGKPRLTRTWSIVDAQGDCPLDGFSRDTLPRPRLPQVKYQSDAGQAVIDTGTLRVAIQHDPCRLAWYDSDGHLLTADHPVLGYESKNGVTHTLIRDLSEHYYGFGEKSGPLDKHSRRLRMENTDAFGYDAEFSDPLYKHIPFYITLRDSCAYGLFYDTPYTSEFDMGAEIDNYYGDYRKFHADGGDLDYYFIYGPSIEAVVERYTALVGRSPLPPRWTLGYLGSTMNYTDAPDAQVQLARFVEKCREYDVPCSGFHLSSGYSMGADGKRYVFTWNRDRVPDPKQMTRTFHEAGIKVVANIKPAMLTTHPRYEEAKALFIRDVSQDSPDLQQFWGGFGAHLDFTKSAAFAWWKQNVRQQLLDYGIDATWNDNNEFHLREDAARCEGFDQTTTIDALRPIQTQLMVRASYEAQREYAPEKRPWLLTRAGAPGIQRYAATWTGDNRTAWKSLRYNIPMGLGLSLSGWANFGHDVGGFAGDPPDPELLVRWVQNGIFNPRFCIHSWRSGGPPTEAWMYPDVLPIIREAIKFRYRLLPYLYSLLYESAQTGHPVVRPMVYHFASDPRCHTESFDFMLGPSLLVPSVLEPGATTRTVYLPERSGWYDWHSGAYYRGGQTITLDAPLDHIPLLAREGGIIPTIDGDLWRIYAFPHQTAGETSLTVFWGDGERLDHAGDRLFTLKLKSGSDIVILEGGEKSEWVLLSAERRLVNWINGPIDTNLSDSPYVVKT